MRYLIWLLALSLTLPACARQAKPRRNKAQSLAAASAAARQQEPVLVFQRTPCYGTCPAYTATIFADGRVEYTGERFVQLVGSHTLSLPVATVNELLAEAKKVHFEQFQERYSGNVTDMPATIVTVRQPGAPAKAVYAEQNIPASLQGYLNLLKSKLDPLANSGPTK